MSTTTMKNIAKGFTVIELLVVVAIIAVLAVIVLVNVTGYINRGKNAAIKSNLGTIATNAAVHFNTNGNYTTFNTTAGYTAPAAAAQSANGGTAIVYSLRADNIAWCACSVIRTTSTESGAFCVDSTGYKGVKVDCSPTRCSVGATPTDGVCKGS